MSITDDEVSKALTYLATSAEGYSKARGLVIWTEGRLKIEEASGYLHAEGTQDERRATARVSPEYLKALESYRDATIEQERIKAYRIAAEAKIALYRTMAATKRAENIA